jgi:hypothetical protein
VVISIAPIVARARVASATLADPLPARTAGDQPRGSKQGGLRLLNLVAYLDAGSGSMIVQILVGGLAAAGVAMKIYWRRLMTFLRIRKPDETEPASSSETA